jgi:hypothetical protein
LARPKSWGVSDTQRAFEKAQRASKQARPRELARVKSELNSENRKEVVGDLVPTSQRGSEPGLEV